MKSIRGLVALCALALLAPLAPAAAQSTQAVTVSACGSPPNTPVVGNPYSITQDTTGKLCTAASVTATTNIVAFGPSTTAPLAVTTTTARVALPTGATQLIQNTGTVDAYLVFGNGTVNATTSGTLLRAGYAIAYDVSGSGATNVAAITASGATNLVITGGSGLPALAGASSTGGGGGTSSSFAAAFPATGTAIGAKNGANMVNLAANASSALLVDGSATTQPVSAASLPLPTGASTSAIQSETHGTVAPGTAATKSELGGAVYTAAGITLTTGQQAALQLDSTGHLLTTASVGGLSQGSTTSGQTGVLNMGAVTTSAPSYTTAQTSPLSLSTTGDLRVADATVLAAINSAVPAGTNIIGKVGIDQTTPGTTNGVQDAATSATGSAVPSKAIYAGAVSSGNVTGLIQADASAAINVSTATTTQIVALASSKKIYVSSFDVIAGGTGNITFEYGTGASCGTGTTVLTGAYNLTAQAGIAKGNGLGAVLVVPASNALCVVTSAAVQMSGSVSYTQF